jgi:hypothetical protein
MLKEVDNSELNNFYKSIDIFTYSGIFALGFLFAISLTNLSYELLVSLIHIITFIGAILQFLIIILMLYFSSGFIYNKYFHCHNALVNI